MAGIEIGHKNKIGPMKVKQARLTSVVNLAALAVAAVFYLLGWKIAGLTMMIVALVAFCCLIGTGVYRIAGGNPLDDIEKTYMQKSYAWAYWIVATGLITAVVCLQIFDGLATLLHNEDAQSFLFWSLVSVVMVLPAAFLAWTMPVEEIDEH